jgi:hypothetical protein
MAVNILELYQTLGLAILARITFLGNNPFFLN